MRISAEAAGGRVRLLCQQRESMDPTCFVSTVQAGGGGVMLRGMFSWRTLGHLIPIINRLNATAYLSIVAASLYGNNLTISHFNGSFQHDIAPCHKGKVVSNRFVLQWPP